MTFTVHGLAPDIAAVVAEKIYKQMVAETAGLLDRQPVLAVPDGCTMQEAFFLLNGHRWEGIVMVADAMPWVDLALNAQAEGLPLDLPVDVPFPDEYVDLILDVACGCVYDAMHGPQGALPVTAGMDARSASLAVAVAELRRAGYQRFVELATECGLREPVLDDDEG